MREALHWIRLDDGRCQCRLCPHGCVLGHKEVGKCGVRQCQDGRLFSLAYEQIAAIHVDPMEKKPLYHFHPGTDILSIGTNGCNLACSFCQNWQLSQETVPTQRLTIPSLVSYALKHKCQSVAYTYSEPLVAFEYVLEACKACHCEGIKNVLVTNGYILPDPLLEILPHVDAANVDLKGIRDGFYQSLCGARVKPVREALETMKGRIHLEVTNLLVTQENDSEEDVRDLVDWIAEALGTDTPLHLSRYFPQYKLNNPPTPISTLERAFRQAKKRLQFVYVGNAQIPEGSDTTCPGCQAVVVTREGYVVDADGLEEDGTCQNCGLKIAVR